MTGAKHRAKSVGCDDYIRVETLPNGWLAVAFSDGAGSASAAALGSRTSVDAVLRSVKVVVARLVESDDATRHGLLAECFAGAVSATLQAAEREERPATDLNATLTLTLFTENEVIAAQVGDGAVVVRGEAGEAETMMLPDTGEHAGETVFLASPMSSERFQMASACGVRSVAMFTDGLQHQALNLADWSPFQPFYRNVFDYFLQVGDSEKASSALMSFLGSEKLAKASDDDLTLGVVTRETAPDEVLEIRRVGYVPAGRAKIRALA
jgi:hypothetical protein